jgi:hypothetical protein
LNKTGLWRIFKVQVTIVVRHSIFIITTLFWAALSFGQSSNEQDFAWTIKKVVAALSKRDSVTLSRYIDKRSGVYILNRIGCFDTYKHQATLGFSDTTYPNAPLYDNVKPTTLKYSRLPTFDCENEKWTKTGTFVDTAQTDHLLSKIAKGLNKESQGKVSAKKINEFYALENKSRRIVIADNNGGELIIYLSFINNKWVLTIIDKATCDCSV